MICCTPKSLPDAERVRAAENAIIANPANRPAAERLLRLAPGAPVLSPLHLAVMTTKYWGARGVKLTVAFPFDSPAPALRKKILQHMNAWGKFANVTFAETRGRAQVRIARTEGDGYWSYVGTDILSIPQNQPTMNLDSFTLKTPESEYKRVVRHETGHTLGFPHEHMRRAIVSLLDPDKTIAYFQRTQGWSAEMVRAQVLTPIDESSLLATPADVQSIMCYQIPGDCTISGEPIPGGLDIDATDKVLSARIYPKR